MLGHTPESNATGTPAQCRLQITPISYANPHRHRPASLKSTETSKCNVWEREVLCIEKCQGSGRARKKTRDRRVDIGRVTAMMNKRRKFFIQISMRGGYLILAAF